MISIPFPGSKRNAYKYVKKIVEDNGYTKVYEPFGGSGVLSVNLYNDGLVEKAVINDYDKLFDDYEEFLNIKDEIVEKCYKAGFKKQVGDKIDPLPIEQQEYLQSLIKQVDSKFYTLLSRGSCFTFSAATNRKPRSIHPIDFKYFKRGLDTTKHRQFYNIAKELEIVSLDYKEFIDKYKDEFDDKTLIIVDPPYVNTYQTQYGIEEEFNHLSTQEIIKAFNDLEIDYLFFNEELDVFNNFDNVISINRSSPLHNHNNPRKKKATDLLAYIQAPKNGCLF